MADMPFSIGILPESGTCGILRTAQNDARRSQMLVSRQALWLGLAAAALLAGLGGVGAVFRAPGDRPVSVSTRHRSRCLPHVCRRALAAADRGLLAQGRAAALAVGKRRTRLSG